MISSLINALAKKTAATKALIEEVDEFRALKVEIDKARCIVETDADGNITSVNANLVNALQYSSSADLVSQHHRTIVGRLESTSPDYAKFWAQLKQGISAKGSFKLQSRTGETVWMQGYYAPVMANGSLRKVVAYLTDITKEKNNTLSLQAEDSGLNTVFSIMELSVDTEILDINDLYLKELGYTREELVGRHLGAIMRDEDKNNPDFKVMWDKLKEGVVQQRQVRRVSKDGRDIWFQAGYFPIKNEEGKTEKVNCYCTSITVEKTKNADYESQIKAISRIQGVIEFDLKGNILDVNDNFAGVTGYSKAEIVGKHHSMFVEESFKNSSGYRAFWEKLGRGEADEGVYKRVGRGGKEIWLQASYNPIFDLDGKPYKVVKYATDVTAFKLKDANNDGQITALNKVLGVIEFDLKGNITQVNQNFLNVVGYTEKEVVGQHHSLFVDPTYKNSQEYRQFWEKLAAGEPQTGKFNRFGKGGKDVWLEASYNPIFDLNGKPFKVVKFATDISEQYKSARALEQAVIESKSIIDRAEQGDLSERIPLEGKEGAIGDLCLGINALMDKMSSVLTQIREASDTINTAASEISMGNTDLSNRTEQQASSLEETASSMEELSSTVKQNAENAKQANQLAAAASSVAMKGGQVVGEVVSTMSAINESAHKIEDIISVIDGIAFQTNILALNAAVEAARAGEQGRGFAVVAGEVRNLAQRSASAAKEIKELITDSVSKTAEGTKLVENAGKTMDEIVSSVQRVTDIMGEISAASAEQSSGIDQVNQAIGSMDEVTQQNAALVEEAAAAAESLVEQADTLMNTVSAFRLKGMSAQANAVQAKAERRASHSPMRASKPVTKPASKASVKVSQPAKVTVKTGTDDGDWEEF